MQNTQSPFKAFLVCVLCATLVTGPIGCGARHVAIPAEPLAPGTFQSLHNALQESYADLFRNASSFHFTQAQIDEMSSYLDQSKDYCVTQFKDREESYNRQLDSAQGKLKRASARLADNQRHDMHCRIQDLRALSSQAKALADHGIPTAYDNRKAKLELIEKWPSDEKEIRQEIASGAYLNRHWGDVKDIGFREIEKGQKNDIKAGEEAVKQLKETGLLPHPVDDKEIQDYVNSVAQKVAAHSDLHIPLHVTVLNSKEIDAFALPGGYVFVQRGLLEAADDEAELAGVLGHEIAHDCARHAHKLMERATVAGVLYQAAEIGALVLTGGAVGIGMYYALQYGFYGLGLILDLKLLGVSREFELQADQLGAQYAWNAGYDPNGFVRFFDKMATKEGYVNGLSWFRTHPPFYERMVDAEREIMFLPKKPGLVVNTSQFTAMKKELKKVSAVAKENEKNRPSLLAPEQGCAAPAKLEYKSGEPIEKLCSASAQIQVAGK